MFVVKRLLLIVVVKPKQWLKVVIGKRKSMCVGVGVPGVFHRFVYIGA